MLHRMIKLVDYKDIEKRFGPHGDIATQVRVRLPFKMFLSWRPETIISSVYVHPYIAEMFEMVMKDISTYYTLEDIQGHNLNEWGGSFNDRYSRGSNRWSVHSWGLAVDYLPSYGPFRQAPITPAPIVEMFKDYGFAWGGDWSLKDGMHFTAIKE